MQMQFAGQPLGYKECFRAAIFAIAKDGSLPLHHVNAKLMGPARDRTERQPGYTLAELLNDFLIRQRLLALFVIHSHLLTGLARQL